MFQWVVVAQRVLPQPQNPRWCSAPCVWRNKKETLKHGQTGLNHWRPQSLPSWGIVSKWMWGWLLVNPCPCRHWLQRKLGRNTSVSLLPSFSMCLKQFSLFVNFCSQVLNFRIMSVSYTWGVRTNHQLKKRSNDYSGIKATMLEVWIVNGTNTGGCV